MLTNRPTKEDPEERFIVVKNVSGATIPRGCPVTFAFGSGYNGSQVTTMISTAVIGKVGLVVGNADDDIADGQYGRIQVWGYDEDALVKNDTAQSIAPGDSLMLSVLEACWTLSDPGQSILAQSCSSWDTVLASTPAAIANRPVFLRLG